MSHDIATPRASQASGSDGLEKRGRQLQRDRLPSDGRRERWWRTVWRKIVTGGRVRNLFRRQARRAQQREVDPVHSDRVYHRDRVLREAGVLWPGRCGFRFSGLLGVAQLRWDDALSSQRSIDSNEKLTLPRLCCLPGIMLLKHVSVVISSLFAIYCSPTSTRPVIYICPPFLLVLADQKSVCTCRINQIDQHRSGVTLVKLVAPKLDTHSKHAPLVLHAIRSGLLPTTVLLQMLALQLYGGGHAQHKLKLSRGVYCNYNNCLEQDLCLYFFNKSFSRPRA